MVAIEIDGHRFEGATEADVRKATRAYRRAERAEQADRETAYARAEQAGYKVLAMVASVRAAERAAAPSGWRVKRPGEQYGPTIRDGRGGIGGDIATYETPDGLAEYDHAGCRVVAVMENGAGFDLAVFVRDDTDTVVRAFAIGVCRAAVAIVDLPGMTPEMFERRDP